MNYKRIRICLLALTFSATLLSRGLYVSAAGNDVSSGTADEVGSDNPVSTDSGDAATDDTQGNTGDNGENTGDNGNNSDNNTDISDPATPPDNGDTQPQPEKPQNPIFSSKYAGHKGWAYENGKWYFFTNSSTLYTGWLYTGGVWYFLNPDDKTEKAFTMSAGQFQKIDGATYYFDGSGKMLTGWIAANGGWYYAGQNGALVTGWLKDGGIWYYLSSSNPDDFGRMYANQTAKIGSYDFAFNASGQMMTGWAFLNGGWYYAYNWGNLAKGWLSQGNTWYWLDWTTGYMSAGTKQTINGRQYIFNDSGAMRTGWIYYNGSWYYAYSDGALVSGWVNTGGKWYYMYPDGDNIFKMVSNTSMNINGVTYTFTADGSMKIGWALENGKWFFYDDFSGQKSVGWKQIGGKWYYFYSGGNGHEYGEMAASTSIEGYRLNSSGEWADAPQMAMTTKAQSYSSSTNYLILVDLADCKVGVYSGRQGNWNLLHHWVCSPGAPGTPTVRGIYTAGIKGYYFDSGAARCFYYTQISGNYLFHSNLYNRYDGGRTLIDGRLGQHLSHGCVRLDISNAKWIYDNIPQGTTIVTY